MTYYAAIGPFCLITISVVSNRRCQQQASGVCWTKKRPFIGITHLYFMGRRSVGIATRYWVDGLGIESRWGARFSASVHTVPGAHPASYTLGAGSLSGVKRPGRGVDYPPPFNAEVKERVELYLYSPFRLSWPVLGWRLPLPSVFLQHYLIFFQVCIAFLYCSIELHIYPILYL